MIFFILEKTHPRINSLILNNQVSSLSATNKYYLANHFKILLFTLI